MRINLKQEENSQISKIFIIIPVFFIISVITMHPYKTTKTTEDLATQSSSIHFTDDKIYIPQYLHYGNQDLYQQLNCPEADPQDILKIYGKAAIIQDVRNLLHKKDFEKFSISTVNIESTKIHQYSNAPKILVYSTTPAYLYKITGSIPFTTIMKYTEDLPYGAQKVIQPGKKGKFYLKYTKSFKCSTHNTKLERIVTFKITPPKNKIILKGAPPQYRTIEVDGKRIKYYRSLTVWATSYDSSCAGCNNITATGKTLTYGIIAVDPKVIPLHSCMYVPGYGYGQAEDTGGAIKGNKIDLAFDDIKHGWWSARYVTIYLIDCKEAQLPWNK